MPNIKFSEAITEALREEMERDEKVFVMGEDVSTPSVSPLTAELADRFGKARVRNTPISELGFTGAAVGAAMAGYRPVLDMRLVDFTLVAIDPIANQAPKLRYMLGGQVSVPLVIRTPQGGGVQNGPTHSQSLESWFMKIPGLKVAVPSDAADAKGLLKTAIRDDNPVIFTEYRSLYPLEGPVPEGDVAVPFGKAAVKREGSDITLIGVGSQVPKCMEAAEALAADGISAEVIDPRTISPLDTEGLAASAGKTGRCVVVEEGHLHGGVGAEIAAALQAVLFGSLKVPIERVAALNAPIPVQPKMEAFVLPSTEKIAAAARIALNYA
ncbi:MAG: pyruvate dehydrogenase complex E1 component subunit beta [Nitrospinota bacterium]|jgi:pyruvate/2-oxoglutarate/acetoin dehydrogenase E1 component|nr:alpha-ketoacid dehydrogenase subunit beta [Nitrospinota bacterium]MDP6364602.1 pyruvate dehydrogenase complex E1 component subunit beta [Nitrospinota bacterium]|tara:strand:- start:351 stop:1328 length:978 start_codon:yes stop_codon:yes gene_type:complete